MKRFTKFIQGNISGKKVLTLFILTNVVAVFMLTVTIPKVMGFANGMTLLDMMQTGYDLDYVNNLFSALGDIGRKAYLTNQIPVDMFYPFLFGLTYCLLLAYFLNKLNKLNVPYTYLCLLPIIVGLADYVENFGIIAMLKSYPELTEATVNTISVFTVIKSISTSLYFVILIITILLLGLKTIIKRNNTLQN